MHFFIRQWWNNTQSGTSRTHSTAKRRIGNRSIGVVASGPEELEGRIQLSAIQTFDVANTETAYVFGNHASAYNQALAIVDGGPSGQGKFIRLAPELADGAPAIQSSITFPATDPASAFVVVDFDFRITPKGNGNRADGMGFALLNTANFPGDNVVPPAAPYFAAEEPNFVGSLGIGFDIFNSQLFDPNHPDTNGNELEIHNRVSIHFNGALIDQVDATPFVDLASGVWTHARLTISQTAPDTDSAITLTLTPGDGGDPIVLINNRQIAGLRPYAMRPWFAGRSGGQSAGHDLDNVVVNHSNSPPSVVSLEAPKYQVVEGMPAINVTVKREGNTQGTTSVNYNTSDLSAIAGTHFTLSSGTLTFNPGETEMTFAVPITNNATKEAADRVFAITLTTPQGGVLGGDFKGTVTIVDDELALEEGSWSDPFGTGITGIHSHLLSNGKLLLVDRTGGLMILDPVTGETSAPALPPGESNFFCSGHVFLSDGRLLVVGGHMHHGDPADDGVGIDTASIYDPKTNQWTALPPMTGGRWYPSALLLPTGDVLVLSGSVDNVFTQNTLPQVFQPATNTWRDLTTAQQEQLAAPANDKPQGVDLYPRLFVAPDGRVFKAGPDQQSWFLDTTGTGHWTKGPLTNYAPPRTYGVAVMYEPGKIMLAGGGEPATNSVEVIDLNLPNPQWQQVAPMAFARRQHNAVILPDGKVLITGGSSGPGFSNEDLPVLAAELWDPTTMTWTTLSSEQVSRLYHSTALLVPDGRVLSLGGGQGAGATSFHADAEAFSPAYLFHGDRPTIAAAPSRIVAGTTFNIDTSDAASIAKVTLVRPGSVTHSYDMNQLFASLSFSATANGLTVTLPTNANLIPNAVYMLFVVDQNGVPSEATFTQIGNFVTNLAPTISNIADQSTQNGMATAPTSFTIGDAETTPNNMTVSATSSNPNLIPNGNIVISGTGASRTISVTPVTSLSGQATITVSVRDRGLDGIPNNAGDATTSVTFNVTVVGDVVPPTLNITPNGTTTKASPITFTFQFSEPVNSFELSDIGIINGTPGTLMTFDTDTYTLNVTPIAEGAVSVSVPINAVQDAGLNFNAVAASAQVGFDQTAPTAVISAVVPDPTTTSVNSLTITFSEVVTGTNLADFTLTRDGGPNLLTAAQLLTTNDNRIFTLSNLSGITNTPGTYVLTLNPVGSGIQDGATNLLAVPATETWVRQLPQVTLETSSNSLPETGGAAIITARLSGPTDAVVFVTLSFTGTAVSGVDYVAGNTHIMIPAGTLTGTIYVNSTPDGLFEGPETIVIGIVSVVGGTETGNQELTLTIEDDDHAPVFQTPPSISGPEGVLNVIQISATDLDVPAQPITYSISGGSDQTRFSLSPSGQLRFLTAPDFESPGDQNQDNIYEITITANDGKQGITTQAFTVTVTDVSPELQLNAGGPPATWTKRHPPAKVLPTVTVEGTVNLAGGTLIFSSTAVTTRTKSLDLFQIPAVGTLGAITRQDTVNGKFTLQVTLSQTATLNAIESFLRGITFSTKGKGLKSLTRSLHVSLTDSTNTTTATLDTTINVRKK